MKNLIIIIIITLFLFACSSSTLKEDYKTLKSNNIILPQYKYVILNGKDTLFPDLLNTKLKLIIFCDSTKCNSCAIESLYGWKDIINKTNRYKDLSYYFIFNCKNNEKHQVDSIIRTKEFNYPIIFDSLGEFSRKNNHLPKNDLFHTFLLADNKVIMVGNPRRDTETMDLFKKTIEKYSEKIRR